jgi:hypothetical protein
VNLFAIGNVKRSFDFILSFWSSEILLLLEHIKGCSLPQCLVGPLRLLQIVFYRIDFRGRILQITGADLSSLTVRGLLAVTIALLFNEDYFYMAEQIRMPRRDARLDVRHA